MATKDAKATAEALIINGVLPCNSATYGAAIVNNLDMTLQMPKTVDANRVGINWTFAMKHILKAAAHPNLARGMKKINNSN